MSHPDLTPEHLIGLPEIAPSSEEKPKPTVVDRADRLEAELLTSRLQNIQLQLQIMQQDMVKAGEARNAVVKRMQEFRVEFMQKYGLDLTKVIINDDGTFRPVKENVG